MQIEIVRWADENDVLLVHPGAGAAYLNGPATAAKMKAMGLKPGTPDLLVLEQGADGAHCLAVELKVPGKTLPRRRPSGTRAARRRGCGAGSRTRWRSLWPCSRSTARDGPSVALA